MPNGSATVCCRGCNAEDTLPLLVAHVQCGAVLMECAVGLLQYTATLRAGSPRWNVCVTPPHRLAAAGYGKFCNIMP